MIFISYKFLSLVTPAAFAITLVGLAATIGRYHQARAFRSSFSSVSSPPFPTMTRFGAVAAESSTNDCNDPNDDDDDAPVILVIGACALDRLVTVSSYPAADAKIRSTSYNEQGGGNAANTASAIGKLAGAALFSSSSPQGSAAGAGTRPVRVRLLTKIGDDSVGRNIVEELRASGVETSSPLFRKGGPGTTTAFTTVIVDETAQTRTCIHTPGTCGELSPDGDAASLSATDLDEIFRNVVHLHSDSRHTDVALWLAREAKKRGGITVSCDCEKDRFTGALDDLLEVCDVLFTNSDCLRGYLDRLGSERGAATGKAPLPDPTVSILRNGETDETPPADHLVDTHVRSLGPSTYFARWQRPLPIGKSVVVTHGSMGALCYKLTESSSSSSSSSSSEDQPPHNTIELVMDDRDDGNDAVRSVRHSFGDGTETIDNLYEVHATGILKDAPVVDTTGAGDAFIGGYILATTATAAAATPLALGTGSFVGGRKVGGPGARSGLPTGREFDELVGRSHREAEAGLRNLLGAFHGGGGVPP